MKPVVASVASLTGATLSIREILESGSLLVAIVGGVLAIGAGYYGFRIKRAEWQVKQLVTEARRRRLQRILNP